MKSYAKINIGLIVGGKRSDGYHDIETFFHLVSLSDEISFSIEKGNAISIKRSWNYLEEGKTDLIENAYRLFKKLTGLEFSLSVDVEKHILPGGGLGGGSSNAGTTLLYLNEYFDFPISRDSLMKESLALGSDVPFFVSGFPSARGTGRGEVLTEERPLGYEIDIISPSVGAGTPGMFGKLDAVLPKNDRHLPPHLMENLGKEDFPNDFELVSKEYKLLEKLASKYSFFSLTGSGSCSYGVKKGQEKENFDENIVHGYEKVDIIPSFLLTTK